MFKKHRMVEVNKLPEAVGVIEDGRITFVCPFCPGVIKVSNFKRDAIWKCNGSTHVIYNRIGVTDTIEFSAAEYFTVREQKPIDRLYANYLDKP